MIQAELLHSYQNGNTSVSIFNDGSKIREYEGIPQPKHPESIDLKITDFCDMGCSFCHEQSTKEGKGGDLNYILKLTEDLPAGVELAVGGGNPLSFTDLIPLLERLKERGIIANLTVNQGHLKPYKELIETLVISALIKGIGISITKNSIDFNLLPKTPNLVFHVIAGVQSPSILEKLTQLEGKPKVLILGYKEYGFGNKFISEETNNKRVKDNLRSWEMHLSKYFGKMLLSFDNLAIKQLEVKRYFTEEGWNRFYMGDDGTFTMYVDAVTKTFAISSTKDRIPLAGKNIIQAFTQIMNSKTSN